VIILLPAPLAAGFFSDDRLTNLNGRHTRRQDRRATVSAKGRQAETEAAPIVYVAAMLGFGTDSERAIRWLIAVIGLCRDPLAITLTAASAARR
jgi:hypothetical protein